MAVSVVSISSVSYRAQNQYDAGGQRSTLTVSFRVYRRGYAHVAGIVVSTNGWGTRIEVTGRWDRNEGDYEVWTASHTVQGLDARFAFVCWCEDYADVDNVKKIWNTNGGNQHWATSTF